MADKCCDHDCRPFGDDLVIVLAPNHAAQVGVVRIVPFPNNVSQGEIKAAGKRFNNFLRAYATGYFWNEIG